MANLAAIARSALDSTIQTLRYQRARLLIVLAGLALVGFAAQTTASTRRAELEHHERVMAKVGDIPETYRWNWLFAHASPDRLDSYIEMFPQSIRPTNIPPMIDPLLDAKWMGSFPLPKLSRPKTCGEPPVRQKFGSSAYDLILPAEEDEDNSVPAFLMLHIFSAAFASERPRRALIRRLSPLRAVPKDLRHLVEVKFVVGHSGVAEEEAALEREQAEFGDLVRLDGLQNGENMDQGKTQRWAKWVGRPGGRQAWWVIKCDSDTFPVMPNLLEYLTTLNPEKPTYIGTTLQRNMALAYYMNGFMYGFSWGVIKSLATAELPQDVLDRSYYEDARMGELMFSLPSKPGQSRLPPDNQIWDSRPPISPDPRTGLIRIDTGERMADFGMWFRSQWDEALSWHRVKTDPQYVEAYAHAEKSFKDNGKPYLWQYPRRFEQYRSRC